jgi:ADP-ribose pyrophosphatase YjhB (NUDIX family)
LIAGESCDVVERVALVIVPGVTQEVVDRAAARIVLLDPEDRILLQEMRVDESDPRNTWITPGGALAPGETHRQAALRELREEVGQAMVALGPCVWVREHEFEFRGIRYRQRERFFLARTESSAIDTSGMEPIEVEIVMGHRWWRLHEIEGARETVFAPRLMAQFLAPLIERRIPERPIDVGV